MQVFRTMTILVCSSQLICAHMYRKCILCTSWDIVKWSKSDRKQRWTGLSYKNFSASFQRWNPGNCFVLEFFPPIGGTSARVSCQLRSSLDISSDLKLIQRSEKGLMEARIRAAPVGVNGLVLTSQSQLLLFLKLIFLHKINDFILNNW